jgi:transcriptional regulator GlxA family with amidase domain
MFYPRGVETMEKVTDGLKFVRPRSTLAGQYTCRINRHTSADFIIILVVLRPGVVHKLTGIPMNELINNDVDAELVFPGSIQLVNQRLSSTASYLEMIGILDRFFLELAKRKNPDFHPIDAVLNLLVEKPGNYSLDWLARQACLSPRQLERKFHDYIGISPKVFNRIIRFNQSYQLRISNPQKDWLSIAIEAGYNDYQHLVKDYKDFAQSTPNLLFSEESKAPERVLGLQN